MERSVLLILGEGSGDDGCGGQREMDQMSNGTVVQAALNVISSQTNSRSNSPQFMIEACGI
jgi:hypothetical protein